MGWKEAVCFVIPTPSYRIGIVFLLTINSHCAMSFSIFSHNFVITGAVSVSIYISLPTLQQLSGLHCFVTISPHPSFLPFLKLGKTSTFLLRCFLDLFCEFCCWVGNLQHICLTLICSCNRHMLMFEDILRNIQL